MKYQMRQEMRTMKSASTVKRFEEEILKAKSECLLSPARKTILTLTVICLKTKLLPTVYVLLI